MKKNNKTIILLPVYEDSDSCVKLVKEIELIFGVNIHIILVDDGSIKKPLNPVDFKNLKIQHTIIKLVKNVGHQLAIGVGLCYVNQNFLKYEKLIIMDSDGEDSPSSAKQLNQKLGSEGADIILAQRKERKDSLNYKIFYIFYKFIFRLLTGRSISFGNFMVLKKHAVERLVCMPEILIHVAASVIKSKLRVKLLPLNKAERYSGVSKMNFNSLVLHGFKAIMIFAEDVLIRVGISCFLMAALCFVGILSAITLKYIGYATPGWFSVALGILVIIVLQTGALSLMTLMLTGFFSGTRDLPSNNFKSYIKEIYTQL